MTELNGDATKSRLFAAAVDNLFATLLCLLIASKLPGIAIFAYLGYFLVQEATWHTTLGKWLFGLTIVCLDGGAVGWPEAGSRTLLRVVEVNPILLGMLPGGIAVALSKRKQRLGDRLAGTIVVRKKELEAEEAYRGGL
jgi:uncharacterized RDD family membrane protein YckC